ncbi:MAG: acyltransferase [Bacteroidia bacterium]|nr:acyltransferase [Bacteroidia bacterium]
MKIGLKKHLRTLNVYFNLFRFWLRKKTLGFENANIFISRLDKESLQKILIKNKAKIGNNCDLESGLSFHNCSDYSNLIVGDNCHIGKNCFLDLKDEIRIGNNVTISMNCTLLTHQDFGKSKLEMLYPKKHAPIIIGNNTFIGANSIILKGVSFGEFSIIAAGSVVINDVKEKTVVGGAPAKIIKKIIINHNE